jgi:hypothetical protein
VDDAGDARAQRVAELAQCKLDCSIGREVGLEHREVGTFCVTGEPGHPVVATERLGERTPEVAGRAGDEDDRSRV